jgi:cell wall-associated NlpC family hydrolase
MPNPSLTQLRYPLRARTYPRPGAAALSLLLVSCASPRVLPTLDGGEPLVSSARSQIGRAYTFGGRSPEDGFDCSGLAWWAHREHDIDIPRSSELQYNGGLEVARESIAPGDLLFFDIDNQGPTHVGIYTGRGTFIHAPSEGRGVRESRMDDPYWKERYLGARRYR